MVGHKTYDPLSPRKENKLINALTILKKRGLKRIIGILRPFSGLGEENMNTRRLTLFFAAIVMLSLFIPAVNAQPRIASTDYIQIVDAYYADLDNDGYEDDIKLLVEFKFLDTDPSRVDLNIWIELPSGLTFNVRISIYNTPNEFLLNIDCFDMAIESGWYTVTMLASIMGAGNGKLYIMDEIIFDPPTGGGPGLPPSVNAYI